MAMTATPRIFFVWDILRNIRSAGSGYCAAERAAFAGHIFCARRPISAVHPGAQ
jgi:hypothetical protein